jgi:AraC-like DNA-binding protein
MRTLYLEPGMATQLPPEPFVFAVSPLLRAAILRYLILEGAAPTTAPRRRLMAVIMDEVEAAEPGPWFLPLPTDKRLRKITCALIDDPADNRKLNNFSKIAGASPRNLARLFVVHTGLTFGAWRERLRLLSAMTLLAAGMPVADVATKTGFSSPSAFIAMFKRQAGLAPGQFFRQG